MKRVLIFANHSVFWCGVQRLLINAGECELVAWEANLDGALECIRALRPDVVLVEKSRLGPDFRATVMRILDEGHGLQVVALSLEESTIRIYREERRVIAEAEDLVRVLAQPPAPGTDSISFHGGRTH